MLSVVAGYQLEKKTPFGNWEKVQEAPIIGESATVPDLVEGEEYEYRVAAITDAGVGDYSNATPPVKAERKKRKTTHAVHLFHLFQRNHQYQFCRYLLSETLCFTTTF